MRICGTDPECVLNRSAEPLLGAFRKSRIAPSGGSALRCGSWLRFKSPFREVYTKHIPKIGLEGGQDLFQQQRQEIDFEQCGAAGGRQVRVLPIRGQAHFCFVQLVAGGGHQAIVVDDS